MRHTSRMGLFYKLKLKNSAIMVEVTWAFRKMCSVKSNEQLPKNSHSLLRMLVVYCDLGTVWLKYPDSKTNVRIYLCIKWRASNFVVILWLKVQGL